MQSEQINYIPVFMQLVLAVGFVVSMIIISGKLGPKRSSENKDKNFEARYRNSAVRCGDRAAEFFRGLGLVVGVHQALVPLTDKVFLMEKV